MCVLLRSVLGEWLERDSPLNPMEKNYVRFDSGKLTMKEKRILSTFIFAEAWQRFTGPKFQQCRLMAWVHSGGALTTTGKNDWAIQCPGFLGAVEIPSERIPKEEALEYGKHCWSRLPNFIYSDKAGPANGSSDSSPSSSSSSSDSESSLD